MSAEHEPAKIGRVVIEGVYPELERGKYPVKRVVGEKVVVRADVFAEGHDEISAELLFRLGDSRDWERVPMKPLGNDRWEGEFTVNSEGPWQYTLRGWVNRLGTWRKDIEKKRDAGQDVSVDLEIGFRLLDGLAGGLSGKEPERLSAALDRARSEKDTNEALKNLLGHNILETAERCAAEDAITVYPCILPVWVERPRALFSAWYELFPRSCANSAGAHGTLSDVEELLPDIASMGFDVLYLPPIHPIGRTNRKGKNNSPVMEPGDPGSPWAIGSDEGGHTAVHPSLGAEHDLVRLVEKARAFGMEVALDLAFQCSPDHPWVKEHPTWFTWRPDGTVQHAENPPKKYEDVIPINFETKEREALWEELRRVVLHWVERGISIFRVDNPHTKPFSFWEWFIAGVRRENPRVIFLAEAFTRPKVMKRLALAGFSQSYTYFTWRNAKHELTEYLEALTGSETAEYFRPNFWPNTPDILPEYLQTGGRAAFIVRLVLAATLSSNYGIYGPPFELCDGEAVSGTEEYMNSEKYEIRRWNRRAPGNIREIITRVNAIRRENPALQTTRNLRFYKVESEHLIFYERMTDDGENVLLVAVNLDPFHTHSGWVELPVGRLGLGENDPYLAEDLMSGDRFTWKGPRNFIEINPKIFPAHIFRLRRHIRRERDFDYFM